MKKLQTIAEGLLQEIVRGYTYTNWDTTPQIQSFHNEITTVELAPSSKERITIAAHCSGPFIHLLLLNCPAKDISKTTEPVAIFDIKYKDKKMVKAQLQPFSTGKINFGDFSDFMFELY